MHALHKENNDKAITVHISNKLECICLFTYRRLSMK